MYGMRQELLASSSLWYCLGCAQCSFQCPQDVRFLDIIQGLRCLAIRAGLVSQILADRCRQAEILLLQVRRQLLTQIISQPDQFSSLSDLLLNVIQDLAKDEQV